MSLWGQLDLDRDARVGLEPTNSSWSGCERWGGQHLGEGFSEEDIDRLADDFIAEDRGEASEHFISWVVRIRRAAARRAAGADGC